MNPIVFAIVVVVVLGLAGGVILVLASKFMAVYEDPRIAQVTECLAGANCGGCGYAGCADYAKAIVENGAPTFKCAPGGDKTADAINTIIDVKEESDIDSLFKGGGTSALLTQITGLDDFELICFLVIK